MNKKIEAQMRKWAMWTLIGGGVLIVFAPWLLAIKCNLISFADTGEIGDTIGGITAPIVNFMGALLVYYALRAQINANALIFDQFEYQKMSTYISGQISFIREDINNFRLIDRRITNKPEPGTESISKLFSVLCDESHGTYFFENHMREIDQIAMFLDRLCIILLKIDECTLSESDKKQFYETVLFTYVNQLKGILDSSEAYRFDKIGADQHGKRKVGIPETIYSKYDIINTLINKIKIN